MGISISKYEMNTSQKFPEYVVLWNCGAGVAYVLSSGIALISCLEHFSGIQMSLMINPSTSFAQEFALVLIGLLISVAVCVLNLIYAQYYFHHKDSRVKIGYAATIGFLILVGFQVCRSVNDIATYFNIHYYFGGTEGVINLLNVAIWGILGFDIINAVMGALAFARVIRNGRVARDIYVQEDGKVVVEEEVSEEVVVRSDKNKIAAEVADHAMGHPKPSPEEIGDSESRNVPNQELNDPIDSPVEERKKAEEKEREERMKSKKKELPPLLSANPDNELLGKINREERVLKIGRPTFAEAEERRTDEEYHPREPERRPTEPVHLPTPPRKRREEKTYEDEDTLPVDKSDD